MYQIITYKDKAGNDEVAEYIMELNAKMETSKDARIRYKKIMEYIGILKPANNKQKNHVIQRNNKHLRNLGGRALH